jgi:hypothetical protein
VGHWIQLPDGVDRDGWLLNGERGTMVATLESIPNDVIIQLKDYGWGKSKVTLGRIAEFASLEEQYEKPVFGQPVICRVRNTQGEWEGQGAYPLHAYARAIARFVVETKFDKRKVGQ